MKTDREVGFDNYLDSLKQTSCNPFLATRIMQKISEPTPQYSFWFKLAVVSSLCLALWLGLSLGNAYPTEPSSTKVCSFQDTYLMQLSSYDSK